MISAYDADEKRRIGRTGEAMFAAMHPNLSYIGDDKHDVADFATSDRSHFFELKTYKCPAVLSPDIWFPTSRTQRRKWDAALATGAIVHLIWIIDDNIFEHIYHGKCPQLIDFTVHSMDKVKL